MAPPALSGMAGSTAGRFGDRCERRARPHGAGRRCLSDSHCSDRRNRLERWLYLMDTAHVDTTRFGDAADDCGFT